MPITNAISGADEADRVLDALGQQLRARHARYHLVVVGGAALLALGLVDRPTKDIDVVAIREGDGDEALVPAAPLPDDLDAACHTVARDCGLPRNWLNDGPASLLDFGLPDGFMERAQRREYGPALTVSFASRIDQIHLKLYATVDQGRGKHEQDLRALEPTVDELVAAAIWSRTHDPSEAYRSVLEEVLVFFGVRDADLGP